MRGKTREGGLRVSEGGGNRVNRFEDGVPGEAFDAGIEWARGAGHPITVLPFVQEIGCRHNLAKNATVLDFFFLFFYASFFDELVTETNRYAEQTRELCGMPRMSPR